MKRSLWLVVFLVVVGAALAGCGGQKPPAADITSPKDGASFTAASVQFEGQALDDSKKPVTKDVFYVWNFGDNSPEQKSQSPKATHDYAQSGEYTVTLTVKTAAQDKESKPKLEAKQTSKPIKISVKLNQPPTVTSITATPALGPAPLEVSFSSDAADADGKIASYSWDFGDGSPPSTDEKPTHKYEKDGEYPVKLTVTDDAGATASASIAAPVKVEAAKTPMMGGHAAVEVHMMTEGANNTFMPAELKIKVGTKVRFLNMSGAHSATAYPDKIPAGATAFDSKLMTATYTAGAECTTANGCYEVEFTVAGTYEYKCMPHEALGMKGKITVEP